MCGGSVRPCHYAVLGVAKCASAANIDAAYHKKVEEWRLEGDSSTTQESRASFRRIKEAFEVLSDASRRASYDAGVSPAGFQLAKVLPSMNKLLADIGELRKGISNFTDRMKQDPKLSMEQMLAMLKEINKRNDDQPPAPAGRGRPPKRNGSPSPRPGAPVRKKLAARKARGKKSSGASSPTLSPPARGTKRPPSPGFYSPCACVLKKLHAEK
ncbi:hypothetical protein SEVIR_4G277000v4 [Setaria viridis]|uniref:J domain-containing protein n=1 Tax=Setaria viridis TaxID=4556 RepID=A0A4U6V4V4_SETVI|nr:chaperone protein DnaJ-like [Setaria viridis]TKW23185.1 hypothetical protein SEVIR_4G277000v2 [Setaria viridis]